MKKIFCAAALWVASAVFASASTDTPVSSMIVMPWDMNQTSDLASQIKNKGFNHATFYLNWSDIESRKNEYQFAHYHKYLDALVNSGLNLILVLDMGGRQYLDENGRKIEGASTAPKWLYSEHPGSVMKNFSGNHQWQPDFTDDVVKKHSSRFISQAVAHFSKRYPGKILGFAIGLQEEHEIKYGQTGYQWRDYKESTQRDFQAKYGAAQPIINYNNDIKNGQPKPEPLLNTHREYRESRLAQATCEQAKAIRDQGAAAIGYFAETFTSHDAIYASGVVEKLPSCLDIAVIDYNFYDGYKLVPDADVLPTLANYMGALGYKKVMIGAYAEQWELRKLTQDLIPIINRSIRQALSQDHVIGFELGGFQRQATANQSATMDLDKLGGIDTRAPRINAPAKPQATRIGVLGSATNFYVWHGERSSGRNVHRDALFAAFKLLSSQKDLDVHLIGEKNLLLDDPIIQSLDAIVVPHQAAMPQAVKTKLTQFWKNGGALVQDMRLGEFDENGKATFDWMNDVFGIAKVEWKKGGGVFLIDGQIFRLRRSPGLYTGHASITPRPGYRLMASELLQKNQGIMVRGPRTLAFGFMPQLVEDRTQPEWQQLFVQTIRNLARERGEQTGTRQ
jgi:hypothetical protein